MNDEFAQVQLAENPDQRCACLLLLDTSGSMSGEKINELNDGLISLKDDLLEDDLARTRVDIAIITFDSEVKLVQDFVNPDEFEPPKLTAQYQTYMGTAILEALDRINERKQQYKDNGVAYYRPWMFLITDGNPEGEEPGIIEKAKEKLKQTQTNKGVTVFAVGVGDAVDLGKISSITGTNALRLKGTDFKPLFKWLSESMARVSSSNTGDQIQLPVPGWANLTT